jgi:hypothetical protein
MDMTRHKGPERKLIKITPQTYQRLIKHGRYKDNMNKVVTRVLDWVDEYVPATEKQVNL